MNIERTSKTAPLHEWPNGDLEHLIRMARKQGESEVMQRPMRNKAIQLLEERGVIMSLRSGVGTIEQPQQPKH